MSQDRMVRAGEFSLRSAADRLGVHYDTVRRWIGEQREDYPQLKARKRAGSWIIEAATLYAFAREWPRLVPTELLAEAKAAAQKAAG